MKINTQFAIVMSMAIAASLASTLSQVNAESIPSSTIEGSTVAELKESAAKVSPKLKQKIRTINHGGTVQGNGEFKEAPLKFKEGNGFVEFSKSRPGERISNPGILKNKASAVGTLKKIK
jgi:hypothetical protein